MLNVERISVYILMFGITFLIPSIQYLTFIDELCAYSFLLLAITDCIANGNWAKYKPLWVLVCVLTFYAIYSIVINSNTKPAILLDWIIELKPFIPLFVLLAINPKFTHYEKKIISIICIANATICSLALMGGTYVIGKIVFHHTYAGNIIFLSSMFILYCNIDAHGKISRTTLITAVTYLTLGILSLRSKYYGIYLCTLYFLFMYRPGSLKNINAKHLSALLLLCVAILAAAWNKIQYYFLTGESTSFDPSVIESFARPVLYLTGIQILFDYFPFGSGLASFATYASSVSYSPTYYEYGIHTVHGLSPNGEFNFICDAFYPSLAQFGIIGVYLFVYFWVYIYRYLRTLIRYNAALFKYQFIIGSLIICFFLIESIAGTTLTQTPGIVAMSLLGIICGCGNQIMHMNENITRKATSTIQKI